MEMWVSWQQRFSLEPHLKIHTYNIVQGTTTDPVEGKTCQTQAHTSSHVCLSTSSLPSFQPALGNIMVFIAFLTSHSSPYFTDAILPDTPSSIQFLFSLQNLFKQNFL